MDWTVRGLMDSGHVWMLGRENAASSKYASAEPSQPAAALMCKTSPATPSVLLPAASSAVRRCTLLPLPLHEGSQGPTWLASHRVFLPCPVHSPTLHPAEHPTSAGQVLHLVGLKCPTGWLSLLPQAQDVQQRAQRATRGPFPELCMPWGALGTFPGTGILPTPPRRTWSRERGTKRQSMMLTAFSDSHHECHQSPQLAPLSICPPAQPWGSHPPHSWTEGLENTQVPGSEHPSV